MQFADTLTVRDTCHLDGDGQPGSPLCLPRRTLQEKRQGKKVPSILSYQQAICQTSEEIHMWEAERRMGIPNCIEGVRYLKKLNLNWCAVPA